MGVVTHNRCDVKNGGIGFAMGVVSAGTWSAISGAGANAYGSISRQLVYETSGHTSC